MMMMVMMRRRRMNLDIMLTSQTEQKFDPLALTHSNQSSPKLVERVIVSNPYKLLGVYVLSTLVQTKWFGFSEVIDTQNSACHLSSANAKPTVVLMSFPN